jgi:hypothetical protein
MSENKPPFSLKQNYTNMGKSKWFCPTAKPPSYAITEKISLG